MTAKPDVPVGRSWPSLLDAGAERPERAVERRARAAARRPVVELVLYARHHVAKLAVRVRHWGQEGGR
jgi:hypothetical protein